MDRRAGGECGARGFGPSAFGGWGGDAHMDSGRASGMAQTTVPGLQRESAEAASMPLLLHDPSPERLFA